MTEEIYIISTYDFYESDEIIFISDNYNRSISLFKELKDNLGTNKGLLLIKYALNTFKGERESIWWVEKTCDGKLRILDEKVKE